MQCRVYILFLLFDRHLSQNQSILFPETWIMTVWIFIIKRWKVTDLILSCCIILGTPFVYIFCEILSHWQIIICDEKRRYSRRQSAKMPSITSRLKSIFWEQSQFSSSFCLPTTMAHGFRRRARNFCTAVVFSRCLFSHWGSAPLFMGAVSSMYFLASINSDPRQTPTHLT